MAGRKRRIARGVRKVNRVGRKFATGEADLQRLIYVVFVVALAIVLIRGAVSFHSLRAEEKAVEEKYAQLQEQKAQLEDDLKYINTPEYIERTAREMLKMVMPGEVLYILRDGTTKTEEEMEKEKEEQSREQAAEDKEASDEAGGDANKDEGEQP